MQKHKETWSKINRKQTINLRSASISKGVKNDDKNNNASYTKNYQSYIPYSFAYKVVCIDDQFSKPVVLYREKNTFNNFIEEIFKEYGYCKKYDEEAFQ